MAHVGDDLSNACAPPIAKAESIPAWQSTTDLDIFRKWERYRVLYNLSLAAEVLVLVFAARSSLITARWFWKAVIFRAIIANVCFCVGPVADAYAHICWATGRTFGRVIFSLGLALSAVHVLAFMTLSPWDPFD